MKTNTSSVSSSAKNDVVLTNYNVGGSGGMLPQENSLTFRPLRLFLVASEHPVGEKPVSDIHWFPSVLIVKCWMCHLPRAA